MKELQIWKDEPPSHWDDLVCRLDGTVFHSSIWAAYQSKIQNARPLFLLSHEQSSGEEVGAVALFKQSSHPILSIFVRELVLLSHPFTDNKDKETGRKFIEQCELVAKAWGCSRITLDSFFSGRSAFVPVENRYREVRRVEFVVDLRRESSVLWKGIKKDQRERIRRLEREGVEFLQGTQLEDLKGLQLAREATQEKRTSKGQPYHLSSDETLYQYIDQYLMKSGVGRVFLAKRNEEILAAIFYSIFNGKAYSIFSGSTATGYTLSAQSGLFWEAVTQFQKEGFCELNRGGVPESAETQGNPLHGIYQFKKRLGTTPQLCRSGVKILNPVKEKISRAWERIRALRP